MKNAASLALLTQEKSREFGLVLPAFGIRRGKIRISSINQLNSASPTVKEAVIYITVVYLSVS